MLTFELCAQRVPQHSASQPQKRPRPKCERKRMDTNTSDSFNCSVFDTKKYVYVAIVSAGSATLSALCCVAVICLIVMFKKHYFFIQRLILYLTLAALFNCLSIIARLYRIGYKNQSEELDIVCKATAFVDQTTMCSLFIAFAVITFTLLMTAVFHKNTSRLEPAYLILIFAFPLAFNWIPFIEGTYGKAGAWCWIRAVNYEENCSEHRFGAILRFALWYVPSYVLLVSMMLAYVVIVVSVARQRHRWMGKYDPEALQLRQQMHAEVWPLLFYPIGLFILNIFPLVNRIHDSIHDKMPIYELWMLHAVFSPLQGGYIALVYTLDRETRSRLTLGKLLALLCSRRDTVKDYPIVSGAHDSISEAAAETHYEVYRNTIYDENEPLLKHSKKEIHSKM